MTEYVVIFEQTDDGGWGAYLPDVPGVIALGATRAEVVAGSQEALDAYVQEMRALGKPIPPAVATAPSRRSNPVRRRHPPSRRTST
jgi:predicted RNase H-like HicB family nuclease